MIEPGIQTDQVARDVIEFDGRNAQRIAAVLVGNCGDPRSQLAQFHAVGQIDARKHTPRQCHHERGAVGYGDDSSDPVVAVAGVVLEYVADDPISVGCSRRQRY